MLSRFDDHPADSFCGGVLEQFRVDIILSLVVVENDFLVSAVANDVGHVTQLNPGTGIKNHVQVGVGQILGLNVFADAHDLIFRIDELQVVGDFLSADDASFLAERLQDAGHAQAASQCVTVGANMAGKDDIVRVVDDFAETGPVDLHGGGHL